MTFVPRASRFRAKRCEGVRLKLVDRTVFDGPLLGVELATALHKLYPDTFVLDRTRNMFGSSEVVKAIKQGVDPKAIRQAWQSNLDSFLSLRAKYLLY